MKVIAGIGIGSNLGNPAANVREAFSRLSSAGEVVARSSLYKTQPWGVTEQPVFLNAAALVETDLSPHILLTAIKRIEAEMGRTETFRWGPRLIDLDILTYGALRIKEPGLEIPHPHMLERTFVLVPLAEIDKSYEAALKALLSLLPESESIPVRIAD